MKAPTALFAVLGLGVFIAYAPSAISKNPTTFDAASLSTSDATKTKTAPTKQAREINKMKIDLGQPTYKEGGAENFTELAIHVEKEQLRVCLRRCEDDRVRCFNRYHKKQDYLRECLEGIGDCIKQCNQ